MKQSAIRLCSALLLMLLALAASVAMIGAVEETRPAPERPAAFVWVRMRFETEAWRTIRLYSAEGIPVQTLTAGQDGRAVSELLVPGAYFAITEQTCTAFTLLPTAAVTVESGCGWAEGETLHLKREPVGSVAVDRSVLESLRAQNGGWVDYTLKNDSVSRHEAVRCGSSTTLSCTFTGVPYGRYVLYENGIAQCQVTIDAATPNVTVSLT